MCYISYFIRYYILYKSPNCNKHCLLDLHLYVISASNTALDVTPNNIFCISSCADSEWGTGGLDPPEKLQKYRFFNNTRPDPLKNRKCTKPANVRPALASRRNTIKMVFRWQANDGTPQVLFWILSPYLPA